MWRRGSGRGFLVVKVIAIFHSYKLTRRIVALQQWIQSCVQSRRVCTDREVANIAA